MKLFEFIGENDCYLVRDEYLYGGGLSLRINSLEAGPMAYLTVNLVQDLPHRDKRAYLDINNNPWAEELVTQLGIARPMGKFRRSGLCIYPLYEFDMGETSKYTQEEGGEKE